MSAVKSSSRTLWALTVVVLIGLLINAFVPSLRLVVIVVQVAFVLWHGSRRYGWRAITVFVVAALVISNILENLSIQTGFPFGHYHYTGPGKIFQVPWFIGPAYLATGYLAWVVATALLDDVRRDSPWLTTIGTPVIGAVAMTSWDLAFDPTNSTVNHVWIWENGGGYFGVPLVNFLGWTLTVYLFMQVFALYLRRTSPLPAAQADRTTTSDLQAVLLYAAMTIGYFVKLFTAEHTTVTDATGATWNTADLYETSVLLTVYGMCFIALLALLRIAQRHPATASAPEADTRLAEPHRTGRSVS